MNANLLWSDQDRKFLGAIRSLAVKKRVSLFLVGGVLRDALLNRRKPDPDIDFCLRAHAVRFARECARALNGGFVLLDKEHGCARVVKKITTRVYTFDFSDFRGDTLEDDLLHRDFTVNALALPLDQALDARRPLDGLIDPLGGRADLKAATIRMAHGKTFDEDPLRIVRAFSFAAMLGFGIERKTLRVIGTKKRKLRLVAAERIRDELFRLFSSARAARWLTEMDALGVLELIFPEIKAVKKVRKSGRSGFDAWKHTLETVGHLQQIMVRSGRNPDLRDYLAREISSGRTMFAVLGLAALVHDIGKPRTFRMKKGKVTFYGHERIGARMTQEIAVRIKLSHDEARMLRRITFLHLRPGYLVTAVSLTARAVFRFFRDAQQESAAVLLLALADQRATGNYRVLDRCRGRYERVVQQMIKDYFHRRKQTAPVRLVTGHDLMRSLRLQPSPLIGHLIREIEELQAEGKVSTKQEALEQAAQLLKSGQKLAKVV